MATLTATAIDQQSLNHYYATSSLTESIKTLDDMDFDLESILVREFAPGLPIDILAVV
ncbi:MAG: hypothetical protein CLLPBCKN_000786 [Chroococcidiopsis cubana SAG 39.79]|uniref:Uncharacterized protein n=1 Tax=Chroococcidiopsis cubana SAG 39.79 TaxID=388085 RepID=A0AB37UBV8_9CYAN|nr:hypothetical protein [Chroococcidiopsis cubana]MDZ4871398.1 hypothetical protein [Chroococcidiopsis cubana SAG 39.79]RUT04133.1 hypothetical protein DSM107010_58940 [Chroococcidiopsis cubana SAG 39.79]